MAEFRYADVEINGTKMKDLLKSDEGLVDYSKSEPLKNVSNTKGIVIFELGDYEYDTDVNPLYYSNGVDLSKVAAVAKYGVTYDHMRLSTAINGDDYARIFFNSFRDATIKDFVLYFFKLLDGDIYVSDTSYKVYAKGRVPSSDEEWKAAVDELYSRSTR